MELEHFTAAPFVGPVHDVDQDDNGGLGMMKPRGLWLSVRGDDDWPSWCADAEFGGERLAYRHRVTLAPGANVLIVDTLAKLDEFGARFPNAAGHVGGLKLDTHAVDWLAVTRAYDGIIIAPYHWQRRLELMWYYTWDCASGCIWRARAIANVEPIAA